MKRLLLLILLINWFATNTFAQKKQGLTSDARFVFKPMVFIDYNFYHWYQEPIDKVNNSAKNMGQVFNVLPGLGGGFILGKKTAFLFSLEVSIKYFPFSLDLDRYEGLGAISFPVLANVRFPLNGFLFVQVGGGIQWNQINIHDRKVQQEGGNPFFMTYVGEVGVGAEENIFILYFLRFGYNPNRATTLDFGLRIGLHGTLWD